MHTLKQMIAEMDSLSDRFDDALAEDEQSMQVLIEDVPEFMESLRKTMASVIDLTHKVERIYIDKFQNIQARMADRRAMMRDAGAIAQPMSAEDSAAELCGLKAA